MEEVGRMSNPSPPSTESDSIQRSSTRIRRPSPRTRPHSPTNGPSPSFSSFRFPNLPRPSSPPLLLPVLTSPLSRQRAGTVTHSSWLYHDSRLEYFYLEYSALSAAPDVVSKAAYSISLHNFFLETNRSKLSLTLHSPGCSLKTKLTALSRKSYYEWKNLLHSLTIKRPRSKRLAFSLYPTTHGKNEVEEVTEEEHADVPLHLAVERWSGRRVYVRVFTWEILGRERCEEIANMWEHGGLHGGRWLVEVIEVLRYEGGLAIAIAGYTKGRVSDLGIVDEETASGLFADMLRGLEYCHRRSIAHGAVSRENLLLRKGYGGRWSAVLGNFWKAKKVKVRRKREGKKRKDRSTSNKRLMQEGTSQCFKNWKGNQAAFCEAHDFEDGQCCFDVDMRQAGIVLFEMLTGKDSFAKGNGKNGRGTVTDMKKEQGLPVKHPMMHAEDHENHHDNLDDFASDGSSLTIADSLFQQQGSFKCLSAAAKDIIIRLLSNDAATVPNASEALTHPFVQKYEKFAGYPQYDIGKRESMRAKEVELMWKGIGVGATENMGNENERPDESPATGLYSVGEAPLLRTTENKVCDRMMLISEEPQGIKSEIDDSSQVDGICCEECQHETIRDRYAATQDTSLLRSEVPDLTPTRRAQEWKLVKEEKTTNFLPVLKPNTSLLHEGRPLRRPSALLSFSPKQDQYSSDSIEEDSSSLEKEIVNLKIQEMQPKNIGHDEQTEEDQEVDEDEGTTTSFHSAVSVPVPLRIMKEVTGANIVRPVARRVGDDGSTFKSTSEKLSLQYHGVGLHSAMSVHVGAAHQDSGEDSRKEPRSTHFLDSEDNADATSFSTRADSSIAGDTLAGKRDVGTRIDAAEDGGEVSETRNNKPLQEKSAGETPQIVSRAADDTSQSGLDDYVSLSQKGQSIVATKDSPALPLKSVSEKGTTKDVNHTSREDIAKSSAKGKSEPQTNTVLSEEVVGTSSNMKTKASGNKRHCRTSGAQYEKRNKRGEKWMQKGRVNGRDGVKFLHSRRNARKHEEKITVISGAESRTGENSVSSIILDISDQGGKLDVFDEIARGCKEVLEGSMFTMDYVAAFRLRLQSASLPPK